MIRFAADQNFNGQVIAGLKRRLPDLDIVHVHSVGLSRTPDPSLLAWAAEQQRVLLTHDIATVMRFAYERVASGLPMAGVFEVPQDMPVGAVIEELVIVATCSQEGEWDGLVRFLPL